VKQEYPCDILLVDDEESIRNLLRNLLEKEGENKYSLQLAENGSQAWNIIQQGPVDVVVCDVIMPEMDGEELCRRVKGDPRYEGIYFIMLTRMDSLGNRLQGFEVGADDYISKPFSIEEFLARVRVGVRLRRLQRKLLDLEKTASIHLTVRTLSHEINNPLSIMTTEIELIKRSPSTLPDDLIQRLDSIRENIKRVKQVMAKLETLTEPVVRRHGDKLTILEL
jgi:DNA-binding response OmpR family regulator